MVGQLVRCFSRVVVTGPIAACCAAVISGWSEGVVGTDNLLRRSYNRGQRLTVAERLFRSV